MFDLNAEPLYHIYIYIRRYQGSTRIPGVSNPAVLKLPLAARTIFIDSDTLKYANGTSRYLYGELVRTI
jgi:hypothetical protein